jgi:ankyrin repeat protein
MASKRVEPLLILPLLILPLLALAVPAGADTQRLMDAVRLSDRAAVQSLLQQKADVNATEPDGMTALHWAAQQGDSETAELLIQAGAKVNATTRYGVSPLALAADTGNPVLIEALVKAGADVNATSPEGVTPLMTAARVGKIDALQALLNHGAREAVNAQEQWKGQSALMWAAGEGHVAALKVLVDAGADVQARSKAGFTSLLFAVRNGHQAALQQLLAAGANPNDKVEGAAQTDRAGGGGNVSRRGQPTPGDPPTSALGIAIVNADYDLAAQLLEAGADPNTPDPRGSMLHAIAFMRRPGSGSPPLPQTGALDSIDLARKLLERGADPNARIRWREIVFDRDLAATKLPPNIPVGRNFLTFIGATPFYVASKHGDVALMRLLLDHKADPTIPTVQNVTPLMAAAGLGFWDGESPGPLTGVPEVEHVEAVKILLALGLDVNAVTRFGGPQLEGDPGTLLRRHPLNLLEYDGPHDAPLDVVPPKESLGDMRWDASTALHGAAMRGANLIVQLLVDNGAKLDARNTVGWTPLMCAEGVFVANTEKDWPETVKLITKLMKDRGMNPDLYNQASVGVKKSRELAEQP